ncbi:hypothetical protein CBS147339_5184 [Penicillium roqueforti]|nr:hypothetical protein CBS147339_5184 [Penicillium roqueforti]
MMDQPTHIIDPDGEVIIILRDANSPFAQAPGDTVAGMTVSYSDHSLQSPAEAIKPPPTYSGKQKKKKKSRKGLRAIRSSSEPVSSPASPPIEEPAAEDPAAEDPAAEEPAAEEPAAGEPAEEQVYEPLVKIQVSAKHLIFASSVFKRILTGGWKESTIYLQKGSVEITAESWDIGALLILLHAIHGKYRRIPRKLTLEMLAKVAVIADYYECKESVYSMTDIWINNLEEKIPMTYSRNLILWLWVSWFFQLSSQFKETTSAVMSLSKTYVHGWGLPISHEVIGLMNKRRHEAINHSVFRLHEIRDALLSGSRGCDMAQVKQDPDRPYFKQDPDSKDIALRDIDEEDLYEDAGDLDFSQAGQNVWLSRLPRSLWEHWAHLDDDEEIELGTMRVEGTPNDIKRVSLRLHDRPDNREIPKDYTLQRQTVDPSGTGSHLTHNTYIFTEKDIPGVENRMATFGETRSVLYEAQKREAKRREQGKRWEPYVRKTIPKHTALAGAVSEEFNCLPVENEEFRRISEKRALEALKPRKETVFIDKIPGKIIQARHALPTERGQFVQATRPSKGKSQENKSTRMPQNELLDLIFQCFREFKYWPFKTLKARLAQPEAYLKQTLEMVAHLVKAGDFAMTWELKPEATHSQYSNAMDNAKAELPPGADDPYESEDDPASGIDQDDVQFENV